MLFPVRRDPSCPSPAPHSRTLGAPGPGAHLIPEAFSPLSDSPPSLEWVLSSAPGRLMGREGMLVAASCSCSPPGCLGGPLRSPSKAARNSSRAHGGALQGWISRPGSCSPSTGFTLRDPLPTSTPPSSNKSTLVFQGEPHPATCRQVIRCLVHCPQWPSAYSILIWGKHPAQQGGEGGLAPWCCQNHLRGGSHPRGWKREGKRPSTVLVSQSPWTGLRLGPSWT